jgi:hypothetical protein
MSKSIVVKVTGNGGRELYYKNKSPLDNPAILAIILKDLERMFHAPIKKTCSILMEKDAIF